MSDMTMDLTKQIEKLRPPDDNSNREPLLLRDLLANGLPEPKSQETKHVYRVLRLEQYF